MSEFIAPGNQLLGVMLPYEPFHYLLFETNSPDVLVTTPGNFSNEPIVKYNDEALEKVKHLADAFLLYAREIFVSCDDSIVRIVQVQGSAADHLLKLKQEDEAIKSKNENFLPSASEKIARLRSVSGQITVRRAAYLGGRRRIEWGGLFERKLPRFDAEYKFDITGIVTVESSLCHSGEVLQGMIKPHECPAFGKECTPRTPLGATMVSSEGACAAYYNYGRLSQSA